MFVGKGNKSLIFKMTVENNSFNLYKKRKRKKENKREEMTRRDKKRQQKT